MRVRCSGKPAASSRKCAFCPALCAAACPAETSAGTVEHAAIPAEARYLRVRGWKVGEEGQDSNGFTQRAGAILCLCESVQRKRFLKVRAMVRGILMRAQGKEHLRPRQAQQPRAKATRARFRCVLRKAGRGKRSGCASAIRNHHADNRSDGTLKVKMI